MPFWFVAAALAAPQDGFFVYSLVQETRGTSGAYVGYRGVLGSSGRYDVTHQGVVTAHYEWRFVDTEHKVQTGVEDRRVAFDLQTRKYRGVEIDLDDPELQGHRASTLTEWFWIDPATADGPIRILDADCETTTAARSPSFDGSVRQVTCHERGRRLDDYGDMTYDADQVYWYDAATGYVVETTRREHDVGRIDGAAGEFDRSEALVVTRSTRGEGAAPLTPPYPPTPDARDVLVGCGAMSVGAMGVLGVGFVGLGVLVVGIGRLLRNRPPPDELDVPNVGQVRIREVKDALDLAGLHVECTVRFAPFLDDFAARAVAAGDPAWIAVAGDRLVGFAWRDRAGAVGTVFAAPTALAENFVARGVGPEFFTETRHVQAGGAVRYNVVEGWTLLELLVPAPTPYDSELVKAYTAADRDAVVASLKGVWDQDLGAWLDLQLERGDIGFVARVDGQVVGFGLAAVAGIAGRLTLVSVTPSHRDRGVGTELVRARVTALSRVGVEQVLVEVADWNVGMLHVLQAQGFTRVGAMVVQSTSTEATRRSRVRR